MHCKCIIFVTMKKRCKRCNLILDISMFYDKVGGKNGKHTICKPCLCEAQKKMYHTEEYRKRHRTWAKKWRSEHHDLVRNAQSRMWNKNRSLILDRWKTSERIQRACRSITWEAVRKGILAKPTVCSICKHTRPLHAHHDDYAKPLNVQWVCAQCHSDIHRLNIQHNH